MKRMTADKAKKFLGVQQDGRLSPCPDLPNCVCSQDASDRLHYEDPWLFNGSVETGLQRLRAVLEGQSEARIVATEGAYLRAEFTSKVFKFVDDVEFLLKPEEGRIQFRSASRLGQWDLGANRRRMRELKARFEALA